ncbi:MAG: hypothetical protein NC236_01740 [Mycoplasma sp.]|nr:hypothetical protein [Mycoplasma sp.]
MAGTIISGYVRDLKYHKHMDEIKVALRKLNEKGNKKTNLNEISGDYSVIIDEDVIISSKPSSSGVLINGGINSGWKMFVDKDGNLIDKYRK